MIPHTRNSTYETSSQRVAHAYLTSLVEFNPLVSRHLSEAVRRELEPSQPQLHAFLRALYESLYQSPAQFGLPLSPDMCIVGGEKDPKQFKQDVKKHLDKPKTLIERGMDFLLLIGRAGSLEDSALYLQKEAYTQLLKDCKVKKPFLEGLAKVGLSITETGGRLMVTSQAYPGMMPALKILAEACGCYAHARLGKFNFARGDFRALDGEFTPSPLELYAIFDPLDFERLTRLHQFFTELGYRPIQQIYGIYGWEVQYQGPTRIKASPLVRVEYAQRYKILLQVFIKCASANRIIDLVYQQPPFLQQDFAQRVFNCNGDACGWCHDKKGLGPSEFTFDGLTRTICWYHNPEIPELTEDALQLIQQYALMHAALAVA